MIAADKHCDNSSTQHRIMSTPTEGRPQNLAVLCCIEFEVLPAVTIELPGAQAAIVEPFVCSYCVFTRVIGAYIYVLHSNN